MLTLNFVSCLWFYLINSYDKIDQFKSLSSDLTLTLIDRLSTVINLNIKDYVIFYGWYKIV